MTLELLPGRQAGRGGRSKSETEYRSSCEGRGGGKGDKNKRLDAADDDNERQRDFIRVASSFEPAADEMAVKMALAFAVGRRRAKWQRMNLEERTERKG